MSEAQQKQESEHIQVFVRVRPANKDEIAAKSPIVVEVSSPTDLIVRDKPQDCKFDEKCTFDRAFGPSSTQFDVYNAVVKPLIDEVLAGYNCTVIAYGQNGTGKTYTMEGEHGDPSVHWQNDANAGIIPRSLNHLFDELRTLEAQEYTVRISFLELYNEELFDLLSSSDDASKIRLHEDLTRKGAVIIHGLEEVTVHNQSEAYKLLEKVSKKHKTSHTVFSLTIYTKENTTNGEELLKTGNLNLIDLAGFGSVNTMDQSLLTLSRVITALVEPTSNIPCHESKLTRLLQESLGGTTKTSLIVTVSPAESDLGETISTLDYACRAKNIKNRPEINQKLSKALPNKFMEELERLSKDLLQMCKRNEVEHDRYAEIDKIKNHRKALEDAMFNKRDIMKELNFSL